MRGTVRSSYPALVLPVLALALVLAGILVGSAAAAKQRLTIYAVATRAQYVDLSDGIKRATYQNPFDVDSQKFTPATKGNGATLPGSTALFSFKLYSDPAHKKTIGSAIYNCTFNFDNHASCDAVYTLNGGTLFASGPVDFKRISSPLAITGGTGKYIGLNGEVTTTGPGTKPSVKNDSRLDFQLLR